MLQPEYKFCPTCGGDLERRIESELRPMPVDQDVQPPRRIRAKITIVYQCLGVCGRIWSLFDLDLIANDGGRNS